ncbi:MAG: DUF5110 domain-containing protein [Anaerolineae bacterium]|nr:DUF5110 domain-containing protein [Anaerolineae bacterium]
MTATDPQFRLSFDPVADPAAVVTGSSARFTVLTSRLLRLEYSPTGQFEDRASQAFWYRRQPVPSFQVAQSQDEIEITTEHLRLRYRMAAGGFTKDSLSIELKETGTVWRYGDVDPDNLLGTTRTLDQASGRTRLEPGLLSRSGWAVADDSTRLVFNADSWLENRPTTTPPSLDLYFFGYGHAYQECLSDYCKVTGAVPLLPRWVLGNWWSRYWAFSQDELTQLMKDFREHEVPLSICIVDMDWHITKTGNASRGWTGYTWNKTLFPDHEGFIAWLHEEGLRTALNLHPAAGVWPHEASYPEMARAMGIDPASQEPVLFDISDPKFTHYYVTLLHHPLEKEGVNFWWLDWQQGVQTKLPGLDPLWWLNHLHFYDLGRDGKKRPFIFSRWGGLGNHRYPIGFSGDTRINWDSLAFQPYFTATAANVNYGWWSHDIGGHFGGIEEPDLYVRWVQSGVFSPIMRLHANNNPYHERRPWAQGAEVLRIARDAMQLRHALIPYLYTMSWRNHTTSIPPIVPMYHLHPDQEAAYCCPNQYYFGSELIAAPYVQKQDADTRLSRQVVWFPAGDWFDFFSGEHYRGGQWRAVYGHLDEMPVFARAGAIVPLGPRVTWGGVSNPAELNVHVFPGADNRFELYEDDGETTGYMRGHYGLTPFIQRWQERELRFQIGPATGDTAQVPAQRVYNLVFRGIRKPDQTTARVNGATATFNQAYDEATETLHCQGLTLKPTDELQVTLTVNSGSLLSRKDRRAETCQKLLWAFRLDTTAKNRVNLLLPKLMADVNRLGDLWMDLRATQTQALVEVIRETALDRESG